LFHFMPNTQNFNVLSFQTNVWNFNIFFRVKIDLKLISSFRYIDNNFNHIFTGICKATNKIKGKYLISCMFDIWCKKKLTQEVVLELHQLIFENKCNNNHVIISIGSLTRHEKRGQESNNRNNNFSRAHTKILLFLTSLIAIQSI
jgi:hypothetical protein